MVRGAKMPFGRGCEDDPLGASAPASCRHILRRWAVLACSPSSSVHRKEAVPSACLGLRAALIRCLRIHTAERFWRTTMAIQLPWRAEAAAVAAGGGRDGARM